MTTLPKRFIDSNKRGCPTCAGVDPKSCARCQGHTRLADWYETETRHCLWIDLTRDEQRALEAEYKRIQREKRKAKSA